MLFLIFFSSLIILRMIVSTKMKKKGDWLRGQSNILIID